MTPSFSVLRMIDRLTTGLELRESHFREFKSALDYHQDPAVNRDVKAVCKDIAETLVAFANADGGELFVGVEDDASVTGVHFKEPLMLMLSNAYRTHVHADTPLSAPNIARIQYENLTVVYFHVAKSTEQVHLTSDGRCLQRFDRENRPSPAEHIQYTRQESKSREYDRGFMDNVGLTDLDTEAIEEISRRIAGGQSPEKFLQYMDVAEYGAEGLRLRRAAVLLFATDVTKWHPRCEVRIVRVSGVQLGVGKDYNVSSRDDQIVRGNLLKILESAWETLRPYLTQTKLIESGIFKETLVYPEDACREALVNAVAHRDYSIEGKGVEIFIYDDRLEVNSPGGLLSSISLKDLTGGIQTHQSRNAYVARVLRELGYMREMGEGMLRIYSTMRNRDLAPPELKADSTRFDLVLHHRSVFSPKDQEWLQAYSLYSLSRDEQRAVLLGRDGGLLSTKAIIQALGIVDTEEFRKLVETLRRKGILYNALHRSEMQKALRDVGAKRAVPRFSIRPPDQTEQYRQELLQSYASQGKKANYSTEILKKVTSLLSDSNPYKESVADSSQLLGLIDGRMRPLPLMTSALDKQQTLSTQSALSSTKPPSTLVKPKPIDLRTPASAKAKSSAPVRPGEGSSYSHGSIKPPIKAGSDTAASTSTPSLGEHEVGIVAKVKYFEEYGFIKGRDGDHFFRKSDLIDTEAWLFLRPGMKVEFSIGSKRIPSKAAPAKQISVVRGPAR